MVSLNAIPAVGVGVDKVKPAKGPAFTVKLVDVPLTPPDCHLQRRGLGVVEGDRRAVALPLVKVTDAG